MIIHSLRHAFSSFAYGPFFMLCYINRVLERWRIAMTIQSGLIPIRAMVSARICGKNETGNFTWKFLTGIHSIVLTAAVAVNAHMLGFDLSLIFRHRLELCAAASILAFLLSLYMYARSFLADDDELGCRGILFDGFPRKNFVRGY